MGERIVVELVASDRVEAPLRLDGKPTFRNEALTDFVERINEVLLRAKMRLVKLEASLETLRRNG